MASTFVNNLRLEEMATGEQSGQWGTKTNTNLELIGEALGFATVNISSDADQTETIADASSDNARALYIKVTSTSLSATRTLTIEPTNVKRVHIIENATTGSQSITIKQGSNDAADKVTIPNGKTKVVYLDGNSSSAKVVDAFAHLSAPDITVDDDLIVGDNITLNSDDSVINMGADNDVTLTHDGTTGVTIGANPITLDSGAELNLDSHTGIFVFKDGGGEVLRFTEGNSGDVTIKLATNAKDLVLTDNGDATNMKILDAAAGINVPGEVQTTKIAFTDGDDAITIADGGGVTFAQGVSFGDNAITNVGDIALDSISSDAGTGTAITFGAGVVPNTNTASVNGNFEPDFSQYTNFILTVSNSGNCTLTTPADPDEVAGQMGVFVFIQDGTGGGTLSHANDTYHVAGGTSLTLSTGANDVDVVPYFVKADGTILLGAIQNDFVEA